MEGDSVGDEAGVGEGRGTGVASARKDAGGAVGDSVGGEKRGAEATGVKGGEGIKGPEERERVQAVRRGTRRTAQRI